MKLERVEFDEFRSVAQSYLDIEAGITTLVGINESGKSNVLRALEKADKGKRLENFDITRRSKRVYDSEASPTLTLTFRLLDKEMEALKGPFGVDDAKKLTTLVLTKTGNAYSLNYPAIQYDKSSFLPSAGGVVDRKPVEEVKARITANDAAVVAKKAAHTAAPAESKAAIEAEIRTLEDGAVAMQEELRLAEEAVATQETEKVKERQTKIRSMVLDKIQKEFLPKILFFDSVGIDSFYLPDDGRVEVEKLIATPGKYRPIVNLLALGGITDFEFLRPGEPKQNLLRAQRLREASTKINREVLRVHWPLEDVEFELSAEESNYLAIRLREKDDDASFVPEDRSRGLQWSVAFNIYFLSESKNGELRNAILLIDEPGVFLHIDAQKKLLEETFPAILKGNNQIIYTTHLPYLIHPKYPERIRILERKVKGGETVIGNKAWSEGRVSEIPEPVKTALGTKWTEWFGMADRSCFVEGPSDQVILRTLIGKVGSDINFIPAYGKGSVPSALAISRLDSKNALGLIDNDATEEETEELERKLSLVNLPPESLTKISALAEDESVITTEDIVPEPVYRQAVFNVYRHSFERAGVEVKLEEIPVEYPRLEKWSGFAVEKLGKDLNFRKMEVAREVAEIVSEIGELASNNQKWTVVRKVARSMETLLTNEVLLADASIEAAEN